MYMATRRARLEAREAGFLVIEIQILYCNLNYQNLYKLSHLFFFISASTCILSSMCIKSIKLSPGEDQSMASEPASNFNFYVNINYIHQCLTLNKYLLEQCSFYYGAMNWSQSTELLKNTSEGTFLVRDSSDSRFLYTLSVQRTPKDGPTSVRIHFANGKFYLDADEQIEDLMPKFDSVLDLIDYYCNLSQNSCAKSHIWVDNKGHFYSPICLKKPLKKDVPTLSHVARLAIHQSMKSQDLLPELNLPNQINNFLVKYPHVM